MIIQPRCKFDLGRVREKITRGAPDDFAPEMQKRALENKKEPPKITIDCNVKACSMLQMKRSPWKRIKKIGLGRVKLYFNFVIVQFQFKLSLYVEEIIELSILILLQADSIH